MKRCVLLLWTLVAVCAVLLGCSPRAQPISPPPYPPPVTPTVLAAMGSVTGRIMLQGRTNHEGVSVTIGELPPVMTDADGAFAVLNSVPEGQQHIKAEKPGYLGAEGDVTIIGSQSKTLPAISLTAGDLNQDGSVNLFDLVLISNLFGNQDVESLRSDLNADGAVNLFDLVLVGNSLDQIGPIPFE